jgi:diguanylate cyclase (GGDEF)-like protein
MVDLDQFKKVNDSLGHLEGDRRLQAAASVLKGLPPPSLAARFGGDEFLVLWPGSDQKAALEAAEALRLKLHLALEGGSASLGLSWLRDDDEPSSLIIRADAALVRAKRQGRNRVEFEA